MGIWSRLCVVVCLFGSLLQIRSDDDVDESNVRILTDATFENHIYSNELTLVEFYAPWCGHCKALKPAYAEAATTLQNNDPPIPLAKIDATENSKYSGQYGVSGYPTLLIFRDGQKSDYTGPRDAKGIVKYMRKQVGPALKPLSSIESIDAFVRSDQDTGFVVVGFFKTKQSQLYSSLLLLSHRLRTDFTFGKVIGDIALFEHYGIESDNALVLFQSWNNYEPLIYEGKSKTSIVEQWINTNSQPLVGEYTAEKASSYQSRNMPLAKFYMDLNQEKKAKIIKYYTNRLKKVATAYQGKILVTVAERADFDDEMKSFGVTDEETTFVIEYNNEKFLMEDEFSLQNMMSFVQDYLDGNLGEYIRSQKLPKNNDGPVTVVVGKNFDEIVMDPTRDVLIEFYAPWCGHCKQLAPKYEELGQKFEGRDSVVIAKIDATANDFNREIFEVSGYPTIFLVPAGEESVPILYEGKREVKPMRKFIRKNGRTIKKKK